MPGRGSTQLLRLYGHPRTNLAKLTMLTKLRLPPRCVEKWIVEGSELRACWPIDTSCRRDQAGSAEGVQEFIACHTECLNQRIPD